MTAGAYVPIVYFATVVAVYCYKFQHHRRLWRSHPCLLDYCYLINLLLALMWCGLLPTSLHTAVFVSVNGPMLSAVAIYSIPLKLLDKIHMTNWCACRTPIPGLVLAGRGTACAETARVRVQVLPCSARHRLHRLSPGSHVAGGGRRGWRCVDRCNEPVPRVAGGLLCPCARRAAVQV
jgi:hypothetical protein